MTGELCDCFETKRQGVLAILDAVEAVGGRQAGPRLAHRRPLRRPCGGAAEPLKAAAANWLALATFAGRFAPEGPALLIDVGSTTTDIVPLRDGRPVPHRRAPTASACSPASWFTPASAARRSAPSWTRGRGGAVRHDATTCS